MQHKHFFFISIFFVSLFAFTGCDKDDPEPENQEELITTLRMNFTPGGGGAATQLEWKDLDGDGGAQPVITGGTLLADTTYDVLITVLNESVSPVEDITQEILDEGEDHQFFFAITTGLDLDSYSYLDEDVNGNPIGVETQFTTGGASTGQLQVTLRHEPDKEAPGVDQGDITNAGGETDIEVSFPLEIQ